MWLEHLLFGVNLDTRSSRFVPQGKSLGLLVLVVSLYLIQWVAAVNAHFEIIDNTERDNEVKEVKRDYSLYN